MFAINEINPIKKDIMEAIIDLVYRDGVKGLSIRTMAKKISYSINFSSSSDIIIFY